MPKGPFRSIIKVLIKLSDWSIVSNTAYVTKRNGTYAWHTACPDRFREDDVGWWVYERPTCRYCYTPVPDEVQGTLILLLADAKEGELLD